MFQYPNIGNEVELQLFEKLTKEPIKTGKLKNLRERIKTNIHGEHIPYEMYCNAITVLKVDSVCKQRKNYHAHVFSYILM